MKINPETVLNTSAIAGGIVAGIEASNLAELSPSVKLAAFIAISATTIYHILKSDKGAAAHEMNARWIDGASVQ